MAFQQPTLQRQATQPIQTPTTPQSQAHERTPRRLAESQEWIIFAPSQAESSTQPTATSQTAGLSRVSDLGSINTVERSGQQSSSALDDDVTEDADLDSLDDGLHAFREPALYHNITQTSGPSVPVLPAHDGLGSFLPSSAPVLEQLWQHEQFNPKRKHQGYHRRTSSIQRRLDTVDELEAQANEEKRLRIEKWRLEQSEALMEEVERETRRRLRPATTRRPSATTAEDVLGTTPKQSDYLTSSKNSSPEPNDSPDNEPFWRRITRKFIRDIIGIDEPLLSVILGESLPGEATPRPSSPVQALIEESTTHNKSDEETGWRDKLLQRIAKELGVFVHQLNPHPGAFTNYSSVNADYAGMPVSIAPVGKARKQETVTDRSIAPAFASSLSPNFPPTIRDDNHAENWGFEEEPVASFSDVSLNLKEEREYWERELDVKMVFRYLRDRVTNPQSQEPVSQRQPLRADDAARRAAIIRQHHPLVARAHRSPARVRRESKGSLRRPNGSSCASESLKGSKKASALRSGSSRNYWDFGASGTSATWGEA